MRGIAFAILCAAAALGCSSYQRTYERETQRLEAEEQARQAKERAAHAEASRYAAVVYFAVGSAVVDDEGARELGWFAERMQPYPQAVIEVRGYTDSTGPEASNRELSRERAVSVARVLEDLGIGRERLKIGGLSEAFPARSNETPEGRRSNRRAEVTVR
ncbi:MAG TPA: OmpA family protein [Solirubrobacterales bacterium]|nr:OmpA family protein [Solirubrobacterales bacterium]